MQQSLQKSASFECRHDCHMKFKIDENLPIEIATLLEEYGHDAVTVSQQQLCGKPDAHISEVCRIEKRALVTLDTDFADIKTYRPKDLFGLIVFRLKQQDKPYVLSVARRLCKILPNETLERRLWIVEDGRIRIRGG
jgi:predicted nuclease of predicted toxin-antitoxin system